MSGYWLAAGGALGLGLALVLLGGGWSARAARTRGLAGRLEAPLWAAGSWAWPGVPAAGVAAALGVGALLDAPPLGVAAGLLGGTAAWVALRWARARFTARVEGEALALLVAVQGSLSVGHTLPAALESFCETHERGVLGGELSAGVLRPVAAGTRLAEALSGVEGALRYRGYPQLGSVLRQLAWGARAYLSPEELFTLLRTFEATGDAVREARQEMRAEAEQTRMARWLVTFLLAGGIGAVGWLWPAARLHWLGDLPGQLTLLLIAVLVVVAVVFGELSGEPEELRY